MNDNESESSEKTKQKRNRKSVSHPQYNMMVGGCWLGCDSNLCIDGNPCPVVVLVVLVIGKF